MVYFCCKFHLFSLLISLSFYASFLNSPEHNELKNPYQVSDSGHFVFEYCKKFLYDMHNIRKITPSELFFLTTKQSTWEYFIDAPGNFSDVQCHCWKTYIQLIKTQRYGLSAKLMNIYCSNP